MLDWLILEIYTRGGPQVNFLNHFNEIEVLFIRFLRATLQASALDVGVALHLIMHHFLEPFHVVYHLEVSLKFKRKINLLNYHVFHQHVVSGHACVYQIYEIKFHKLIMFKASDYRLAVFARVIWE